MAKIKCSNCGTKYSGNFCPTCSTPAPEQPQKKKNKWVLPLIVVLIIVLVVACSGGGTDDTKQPAGVQSDSSVTNTTGVDSTNENNSTPAQPDKAEVTLAEVELYNADGIVITATGIKSDLFGPTIRVTASNDSNKNIMITTQSLSVNGYMMSASGLYCDIAAGKKANADLTLMQSELDQAGIDTVADVEFYIHISDSDSYTEIASSDLIAVHTSASGSFTQPVDDSGDLIYNDNDIRIVCKGLKQDIIWDGAIVFYMENNSSQPVTVYAENVSINGYMVDVSLWSDLRVNTKVIDGMVILNLEAVDIDSIDAIENVEFTFRVINSENWNEIDTTDVIKLEFN